MKNLRVTDAVTRYNNGLIMMNRFPCEGAPALEEVMGGAGDNRGQAFKAINS